MAKLRENLVDNEFEAPEGPLEEAIAHIQAEILDIDRVGRTDSFYDLGGASLQAIRICVRIEQQVGYRVLPIWLFENDVLADFVRRVEAEGQPIGA